MAMAERLAGKLTGPEGRRVLAGLTDQAIVALTSAGTGLLATWMLPTKHAAAVVLYALLVLFFVQGIGRAFVGDVMLTFVARFRDPQERKQQFENAHATAAGLAMVAMVVLLGIWLFGPRARVGDLIWGILYLPAILLQDLARYTYQTLRQQSRALVIDLCWIGTQSLGVCLAVAFGWRTGAALLVSWGTGAAVGATVFYARTRINPLHGRPLNWLRDTRHLLGWFTATGVLAQTTTLLIGTLVQGLLDAASFAGLRLAQLLVLQPAQSLVMALNGLLVPRASQIVGANNAAGLRRQTRTVLVVNCVVGLVIVTVAATLARPVLDWYKGGDYAYVTPIAVPIAIQAWLYLMQVPFTVAVRGMHRGRYLFVQYLMFSVAALTGLMIGAHQGGLLGAVWGLVSGAAVGLVVQATMYLRAYHALVRNAVQPDDTLPRQPAHPEPSAAH